MYVSALGQELTNETKLPFNRASFNCRQIAMTGARQSGGLHIIFSIFLGLMLAALAGVGVYTFHPPPEQLGKEIRELERQEQAIRNSKPDNELTTMDRDQIQEIVRQRNELVDVQEEARREWTLRTSIILIVLATFTMTISPAATESGIPAGGLADINRRPSFSTTM